MPATPHVRTTAAIGLLALAGGGCFYTNEINTRPNAEIEQVAPAVVYIDEPVYVSATRSFDDDGDPIAFEWEAATCEDPITDDCTVFDTGISENWDFEVPDKKLIRVKLTVKDIHGACDIKQLALSVANRTPDIELQAHDDWNRDVGVGEWVLGNGTLHFSASATDPDRGDNLRFTYTWQLYTPPTSDAEARVWTEVDAVNRDLVPDVPGLWSVRVTVSDNDPVDPQTDYAERSVNVVADSPPCIAATTPLAGTPMPYVLERAAGPRRFSVDLVADDLDPYPPPAFPVGPPAEPHFRWFIADPDTGGALTAIEGRDLNDFVIDPAAYVPGDRIALRVEAADRYLRWPECVASEPLCSLESNDCVQRVSWDVEVR